MSTDAFQMPRESETTSGAKSSKVVGEYIAYDQLVDESPQGCLFSRRWWLEAVAPGRVRIFEVWKGKELIAAMPFAVNRIVGHEILTLPLMTETLGVLHRPTSVKYGDRISEEHRAIGDLLQRLSTSCEIYQHLHPNSSNWLPFYWNGFDQTVHYKYIVSLGADRPSWRTRLDPVLADKIDVATSSGFWIDVDPDLDDVLSLVDVSIGLSDDVNQLDDAIVRRVAKELLDRGAGRLVGVFDAHGQVHAAVLVGWDRGMAHGLMYRARKGAQNPTALLLAISGAIDISSGHASGFDFGRPTDRQEEFIQRTFGGCPKSYIVVWRHRSYEYRNTNLAGWRQLVARGLRFLAYKITPLDRLAP